MTVNSIHLNPLDSKKNPPECNSVCHGQFTSFLNCFCQLARLNAHTHVLLDWQEAGLLSDYRNLIIPVLWEAGVETLYSKHDHAVGAFRGDYE